jgi:hypothetical protein
MAEIVTLANVHRGKGERAHYVYGDLVAEDGRLLVSATLDYLGTIALSRDYTIAIAPDTFADIIGMLLPIPQRRWL